MASVAQRVCAVVGVGPGNGASFARRFAREGFKVALLARSQTMTAQLAEELKPATARAYACDVGDEQSVQAAFQDISRDLGQCDVVIYNAGSGVWGGFDSVSAAQFEQSWRVNALGGFLVAKQVAAGMKQRGSGSIVFIGATASRRGMPSTVAFAPAKAAQKSLAESLARSLWPHGVHVSLVILDGVVDTPAARKRSPDKPDSAFQKPDDLAELAFNLTQQPRSAWSFEVEARPFSEPW